MPARKLASPTDIVNKTLERARTAPGAWEKGLQNASGTITSNMKAAGPRWKQAMQDAIAKDTWAKSIASLTDDQVISAALKVGGNTWLNGITSRQDKITAAWNVLGPKLQAHMDRIGGLPNVTDADREARMVANLRGMRMLGLRA